MGSTLAEKIIANASGQSRVTPGDIVIVKVDLAMIHDSGGPRRVAPILQQLGVPLFDKHKVVLVADHYIPGDTPEALSILQIARRWASDQQVQFYDGEGICHVVLPERGHLRPGMMVVGGDSHSPTGGAFGAYMFGIGATEMAGVLATGEIWLRVPDTIKLEWFGQLGDRVVAKDMMLAMCAALGMGGGDYQAIEYCGTTVDSLNMQERMTLSNMAAELGAQVGLIAPDDVTWRYLQDAGVSPRDGDQDHWASDSDAGISRTHRFDANTLSPQVAAPHSPANSAAVTDYPAIKIDTAYIGACTGAKFVDLQAAAEVLRGRRVAKGVKLIVAPSSARDQQRAAKAGIMAVLEDAGAKIMPNACGICAGYGSGRLLDDEVCISSTARNFKGRMGASSSRVYLGSPYTVAASAVAGVIHDPRDIDNKNT